MISEALFDELVHETLNETATPWYRTSMEYEKLKSQSSSFYTDAMNVTKDIMDSFSKIHFCKNILQQVSSDILILPSAYCAAESIRTAEGGVIIIHGGLLNLLSFNLDCLFTIELLNKKRIEFSDDELYNIGIAHRPTSKNVGQLFLAIFYSYLNKPIQLPVLKTRPTDTKNLLAYSKLLNITELFIILHESAHLELGHHKGEMGGLSVIEEFMLDEISDTRKTMELEADLHAIQQVERTQRHFIIEGAFTFFSMYGMYEIFTGAKSNHHPYAINRIQNILTNCGESLHPSLVDFGKLSIEKMQQDWEEGKSFDGLNKDSRLNFFLQGKSANQAVWVLDLLCHCIAEKNKPVHSTVESADEDWFANLNFSDR